MRKRSRYRPRGVILDTVAHVIAGVSTVASHRDQLMLLKIRNHDALLALTQGRATRADMDVLIAAVNMTEALATQGAGRDYSAEIRAGQDALLAVGQRGVGVGRFVGTAQQLDAVRFIIELHDAQLDVVTVGDLDRAVRHVNEVIANKRARVIA